MAALLLHDDQCAAEVTQFLELLRHFHSFFYIVSTQNGNQHSPVKYDITVAGIHVGKRPNVVVESFQQINGYSELSAWRRHCRLGFFWHRSSSIKRVTGM